MNRLLLAFLLSMLVASALFFEVEHAKGKAKKCQKPKNQQTAKIVIYPALGNEIVNSGGLYNNYTGICTSCKKGQSTLFFPGQPSAANTDNAMTHGSLDVFCKDYTQACFKGKKGKWYGLKGGGTTVWDVAIYTICNSKGKKCKHYAQLGCNTTNYDATAGLYKLKGSNVKKQNKAKWTCGTQEGPSGAGPAPIIGSKSSKYLQIKGVSCYGCKYLKKPRCKGPTASPGTGGVTVASSG